MKKAIYSLILSNLKKIRDYTKGPKKSFAGNLFFYRTINSKGTRTDLSADDQIIIFLSALNKDVFSL